jgi:ABC-type lipoprotein export system ATPase subunit
MAPLVEVQGLRIVVRKGAGDAAIVDDVSFAIPKGEVLALIGESGSGKTTIALSLLGYARRGCRIAGGSIRIGETKVLDLDDEGLYELRGRQVSYIAQSAASAFNPMKTIMDQVVEGAVIHGTLTRAAAEAKAVELFTALALPDPKSIGARYPHQVSGGQLQRLMAAMAPHHRPRARGARRAHHGARRDHPDRGAARVQEGGARARGDGGVRLPRPGGGRADGRPDPGALRREDARGRRDRRHPAAAEAPLYAEPARRRPRPSRAARRPRRRRRRCSRSAASSPATAEWEPMASRRRASSTTSTSRSRGAARSA